jgi:dihydroorotate dehydrogenase (NAD+) catalytic subunit
MSDRLRTKVGAVELKNPLIAAAAEHLIDAGGVRRALAAGVGAVVVKSTNESQAARYQLQRAEYMVLDHAWRPVPWGAQAPSGVTVACRSGLTPQSFATWLDQTVMLDREAKTCDAYAVASLILAGLDPAVDMARHVEQAGVRILELNIGTPYASQARGVVSTELAARHLLTCRSNRTIGATMFRRSTSVRHDMDKSSDCRVPTCCRSAGNPRPPWGAAARCSAACFRGADRARAGSRR